MKVLFSEIRKGQIDAVRARLDKKPDLVAAIAKAPPAKDDGQQPLQVAFKTGQLEIAALLLDRGADIHFQETSSVNTWTSPVLQDAVRCAVMKSRWSKRAVDDPAAATETADTAFSLLLRLLGEGADPLATDSYGNGALMIFCSQAVQILPRSTDANPRPITSEVMSDLGRIVDALVSRGADPHGRVPFNTDYTLAEWYSTTPIGPLLERH